MPSSYRSTSALGGGKLRPFSLQARSLDVVRASNQEEFSEAYIGSRDFRPPCLASSTESNDYYTMKTPDTADLDNRHSMDVVGS